MHATGLPLLKQYRNMKRSPKKKLIRLFKITGITLGSILLLMFLLPFLFPTYVSNRIKGLVNSTITGDLEFSKARLSFFNHFPALTLTLYDFNLKGSAPFEKETLVSADEVSLGINLKSLLAEKINVDEIYLSKAYINVQVDSQGRANYNVYKSKPASTPAATADTASASLQIAKILVEKSNIVYNDRSLPMQINLKGFYYLGKGDLSKDIFDLNTHTEIDSVDFYFGGQPYLVSKKINADLITQVNTKSLSFLFQKNDLKINQLPVTFTGQFAFVKDGYSMDFKIHSSNAGLRDVFTAMPANYTQWLEKTDVKGNADFDLSLAGNYIAATKTAPDLVFNFKIRDGYIANEKAPSPVKNLFLNFQSSLPGLNADSLKVDVDSIYFNIDKDYFSSILHLKGVTAPEIYANINTAIDLEKWDRAVGIQPLDFKGQLDFHLLAQGRYATRVEHSGIRKVDTVVASIPSFNVRSQLRNGYVKYASLPQAVSNINFNLTASCNDNNYKHTQFAIDSINANVLTNFVKGYLHVKNPETPAIEAGITSVFHLADVKKFYPVDSLELTGDLNANIQSKGIYNPAKKSFPVTKFDFDLQNASIQTKYYPHPVKDIKIEAAVTNNSGTLKGLRVNIKPISFQFEGQPFVLKADLQNFDDLKYKVRSQGTLDIGKIYQVFALKGYNVTGFVQTNISLAGLQSDATAGNYAKLNNKGSMVVKNLTLTADLFPQPFKIKTGIFRFEQDKMWFDSFKAVYGKTGVTLNGYLTNVINYAMQKNAPLQGSFTMGTDHLYVDEFMAFAGNSTVPAANTAKGETGVVMVPSNLAVTFNANAKTITCNGLTLQDFKGQVVADSGKIKLNQTGFVIVDAPVVMDASYTSLSPKKALFDYHITVKEFDIKKAYNGIKLFRDMATSAAGAQGTVSLDYTLAGRLDANMKPVYPSLKGGGVLSIKKVKVKGLKLFGAVSDATNKKDILDPDLSKVDIKTTINNNIITISRTRMRVAGFRPRFEGQVSFDGKLNLKFRLGLPPLGILGIPMTITGTEDKPKVKLGRGSEELKETEDDDKE